MTESTRSLVAKAIGHDPQVAALLALVEEVHQLELEIERMTKPKASVTYGSPLIVPPINYRSNVYGEWVERNCQPTAPITIDPEEANCGNVLHTVEGERYVLPDDGGYSVKIDPEDAALASEIAEDMKATYEARQEEAKEEPAPEPAPTAPHPCDLDDAVYQYMDSEEIRRLRPDLRAATVGTKLRHLATRLEGLEAQSVVAAIEATRNGASIEEVLTHLSPIPPMSQVRMLAPFLIYWATQLNEAGNMDRLKIKEELPPKLIALGCTEKGRGRK
jgi:hypothetical protein